MLLELCKVPNFFYVDMKFKKGKHKSIYIFCFSQKQKNNQTYLFSSFSLQNYQSKYSKVPNKRSATFINLRKIFQGLRSYLEGYAY